MGKINNPQKKIEELQKELNKRDDVIRGLKAENYNLKTENHNLKAQNVKLENTIKDLTNNNNINNNNETIRIMESVQNINNNNNSVISHAFPPTNNNCGIPCVGITQSQSQTNAIQIPPREIQQASINTIPATKYVIVVCMLFFFLFFFLN